VAGCCECGDEPSGSYATELVRIIFHVFVWHILSTEVGSDAVVLLDGLPAHRNLSSSLKGRWVAS
jgi:hypothetical protein